MLYIRTKNKTSTTKHSKERLIRGIPIQLFERRNTEIYEDEIVFIKRTVVRIDSPQNIQRTEADNKRKRAVLIMYLCFLLATPFCSRVSVHKVW